MQRLAILLAAFAVGLPATQAFAAAAPARASHPAASAAQAPSAAPDCRRGYYKNVSGHCVRRPTRTATPAGATARCRDGTYSYSEHASGTCSHHGGVAVWIHRP